jgi:hypothetical protein
MPPPRSPRVRPLHAGVVLLLWLALPAGAQRLIHELAGAAGGDNYGQVVAIVGDVNGDGHADIAISATKADPQGAESGQVKVYSGADFLLLYTYDGTAAGQQLGYSLDAAGDVDGDGLADFIIGTEFAAPNGAGSGSAKVYSGATGVLIWSFDGAQANDRMGNAVSGAGDVDADGFDDLIVGANKTDAAGSDSGSATVFSGATGQVLHVFQGAAALDEFGEAVSDLGDVDGDGHADVLAGANYHDANGSSSGMLRVYSGATGAILYTKYGDAAGDFFGGSNGRAGDVDGDGVQDFIAGMIGSDVMGTQSGGARVFSGATGAILYTKYGAAPADLFGRWVDAAGDVDGDGFDDFVCAIQLADAGGVDAGGLRVFSGIDGAVIGSFYGRHAGDGLGERLSSGGFDVDADGFPDILAGSPLDDTGGVNRGSAQLVTFCGAARYGVAAGDPTQALALAFVKGGPGQVAQGTLVCDGAPHVAPALIGVSTARSSATIAGLTVLLDTTPGSLAVLSASFDAVGVFSTPLDLRQPAISGLYFHVQIFAGDATQPQGLSASNGISVVFCP